MKKTKKKKKNKSSLNRRIRSIDQPNGGVALTFTFNIDQDKTTVQFGQKQSENHAFHEK